MPIPPFRRDSASKKQHTKINTAPIIAGALIGLGVGVISIVLAWMYIRYKKKRQRPRVYFPRSPVPSSQVPLRTDVETSLDPSPSPRTSPLPNLLTFTPPPRKSSRWNYIKHYKDLPPHPSIPTSTKPRAWRREVPATATSSFFSPPIFEDDRQLYEDAECKSTRLLSPPRLPTEQNDVPFPSSSKQSKHQISSSRPQGHTEREYSNAHARPPAPHRAVVYSPREVEEQKALTSLRPSPVPPAPKRTSFADPLERKSLYERKVLDFHIYLRTRTHQYKSYQHRKQLLRHPNITKKKAVYQRPSACPIGPRPRRDRAI